MDNNQDWVSLIAFYKRRSFIYVVLATVLLCATTILFFKFRENQSKLQIKNNELETLNDSLIQVNRALEVANTQIDSFKIQLALRLGTATEIIENSSVLKINNKRFLDSVQVLLKQLENKNITVAIFSERGESLKIALDLKKILQEKGFSLSKIGIVDKYNKSIQIKYFHEEDKQVVEFIHFKLKSLMEVATTNNKEKIEIQDFLIPKYAKRLSQGYVEVWISI